MAENTSTDLEIFFGFISVVSAICAIVCIICTIILGIKCSYIKTYDAQIAIVTEQNAEIEEEISTVVKSYEEYEKTTFASAKINTKDVDFIALAEMYPELQSNELVQSQISLYKENNKELKDYKLKKIKASVLQWWLYFHPIETESVADNK